MEHGFIPTGGGMHWFRKRDASATDFAEHIPGTHAWLRSARLPAWRCRKCAMILFRYGESAAVPRADATSHSSADADEQVPEGEAGQI